MEVIFFIYGLAFFSLGLAVALYPKKGSAFSLANSLWLLAAFAIIHGINEWMDMFIIILGGPGGWPHLPYLKVLRTPLLVISFLFLLLFGIGSIRGNSNKYRKLNAVPVVLLATWAAIVLASGQRFLMADIWGRYLLGAPGIFLSAYAVAGHEKELREFGLPGVPGFLRLSAGALILYGIFSGLVVPDAEFFPASVLNYTLFLENVGVPVQVFRAVCAVALTFGLVNILKIFEWETKYALRKARDELEDRVRERTSELVDTNVKLEAEIAERMRAEKDSRESKEHYQRLFNSGNDAIFVHGLRDGLPSKFLEVNDIACGRLGYSREELLQLSPADIDAPEKRKDSPDIMNRLVSEGHVLFETAHVTKEGVRIPVEINAHLFSLKGEPAVMSIARDVTERNTLEEQLRHALKMEAIGRLTAGLTHEYYNILTAIMGSAEFLKEETVLNEDLMKHVDIIESSVARAARLTDSLLAYSRKKMVHLERIDINETLVHVERLLEALAVENIRLDILPGAEKLHIMADRSQMEQVLMNLSINAIDAMPGGGTLTISMEPAEFSEEHIEKYAHIKPGKYALVSVIDTGSGMDEKTRDKIFEPFFTTKDIGKGTGLGLSMVYGIVKKHKGYITVFSEIGKGTTFKIYLPLTGEEQKNSAVS